MLLFFVILQGLRNARFEFPQLMTAVSVLAIMGSALVIIGLRRAGEALLTTLHPVRVGYLMVGDPGGESIRLAWGRWQQRKGLRGTGPTGTDEYQSAPADAAGVRDALGQIETGRPWVDFPPTREEADAPIGPAKLARYELVLPIRAGSELLGCLALAVKLFEQPYSREDKELLQGVAQAVGMALRNAALVEVAKREARQARDLEIARGVQQKFFPALCLPCPVGSSPPPVSPPRPWAAIFTTSSN
ncbi:MAG: GAF domain-containing protein [candidate division Zixibacteria bacterium]|nr:GAF domain-containing protein [candidate division Zixibacteria bacterium]